ncbi:MAG: TolC family protein [Flavobacteriia bacterium]|nr:TolC family protein [Flavobacteriia bacterium]
MMKKILSFFFLVCAIPLSAQQVWSLSACIEHAEANNLDIQRGKNNMLLAEINEDQSKLAFLPTLNLNGGYYWNFGLTIDPISNTRQPGSRQTLGSTASSNWTLFNGRRNVYQLQQARMNAMAVMYQQMELANNVYLNIASSYLQILVNQQLLEVADGQLKASAQSLKRTEILFENGAISKDNYLQSLAQVRTDEGNKISAENALLLSKLMLYQMLQLDTPFEEFYILVPEVDLTAAAMAGYQREELLESAVEKQPSVQMATSNVSSANYGVKLAQSARVPSVVFSAQLNSNYVQGLPYFTEYYTLTTYTLVENPLTGSIDQVPQEINVPNPNSQTAYTVANQLLDNRNQFLGVGVQIPLFNGGQTHSAVQRAKIQLDNALIDQTQAELNVRQTIERAYLDAKGALAIYEASKISAEASAEALENAEVNFETGTISAFDFSLSKNQFLAAKSREIQSKFDYLFKVKVLEFYLFNQITL